MSGPAFLPHPPSPAAPGRELICDMKDKKPDQEWNLWSLAEKEPMAFQLLVKDMHKMAAFGVLALECQLISVSYFFNDKHFFWAVGNWPTQCLVSENLWKSRTMKLSRVLQCLSLFWMFLCD